MSDSLEAKIENFRQGFWISLTISLAFVPAVALVPPWTVGENLPDYFLAHLADHRLLTILWLAAEAICLVKTVTVIYHPRWNVRKKSRDAPIGDDTDETGSP